LAGIEKSRENLLAVLEDGGAQSKTVVDRIRQLEVEQERLHAEIQSAKDAIKSTMSLPDDSWVRGQMDNIIETLGSDTGKAAIVLRKVLGKVMVREFKAPGKKRGFGQLRFSVDGWETLAQAFGQNLPTWAAPKESQRSPLFEVNLGGPTRMDDWAPKIAEMRSKGMIWKDIGKVTGLGTGNAHSAYTRWSNAQNQ
jgi:hypothetical protein